MNRFDVEQALAGLPLGGIRYYEQIGSTNSDAARWADQGAADLALVLADEQTTGRGRQGRKWFTPPGAALAFSLVLRPASGETLDMTVHLARLTALGALAICQALRHSYGLAAEIKWPNDVLLERRKVAGILAEAYWQGENLSAVILGIGINVAPPAVPPDGEVIFPATCVQSALGRPLERLPLLRSVLESLLEWRGHIGQPAFQLAWEDWLAFKGEWVETMAGSSEGNAPVRQGLVLGIDPAGRLRLRDRDGAEFTLHTGELRLRIL
jgi:BirA family transcriptional regulator, biotin operon repressor / biotin---[acetyl-CoA-carboxylase] ligase